MQGVEYDVGNWVVFTRSTGESQPEQVQEWIYTTCVATFVGFVAGGFYGTRVTADKFIASNQFGKFPSKMHAQVGWTNLAAQLRFIASKGNVVIMLSKAKAQAECRAVITSDGFNSVWLL